MDFKGVSALLQDVLEEKLVCPYCGHEHKDLSGFIEDEEEWTEYEYDCEECGETFSWHYTIRYNFTTSEREA